MSRRIRNTVYDGTTYRSGYEVQIAKQLDAANVPFEFEKDVIMYIVPAQTRKYNPDFKLNGIYIETKGRWTLSDRKKMALVLEQNPKLDIRMLFQSDEKLNKGSKTRYSEWCERRGIPYAVGEVPESWILEATAAQE